MKTYKVEVKYKDGSSTDIHQATSSSDHEGFRHYETLTGAEVSINLSEVRQIAEIPT